MSTEIQRVKNQMALETWAAEVESCQSSGLTVTEWCKLNGINMKTYYYHLRKVREQLLTENCIVPLEEMFQITLRFSVVILKLRYQADVQKKHFQWY